MRRCIWKFTLYINDCSLSHMFLLCFTKSFFLHTYLDGSASSFHHHPKQRKSLKYHLLKTEVNPTLILSLHFCVSKQEPSAYLANIKYIGWSSYLTIYIVSLLQYLLLFHDQIQYINTPGSPQTSSIGHLCDTNKKKCQHFVSKKCRLIQYFSQLMSHFPEQY